MIAERNAQRWDGLDVLKCICAFLVIVIHTRKDALGGYIECVDRIAVPCFLMITGFFYNSICSSGREKKQIVSVFKTCIAANIFYFIWKCIMRGGMYVPENGMSPVKSIIIFVLFSESPFCEPLWYLGGLLNALIILHFLRKWKWFEKSICILPIMLLGNLLMGKYSVVLLGGVFPGYIRANAFFTVLPYLCVGILISRNSERISEIKQNIIVALLFLSFAGTICEQTVLSKFLVAGNGDNFFCSVFLSIFVFIYFAFIFKSTKFELLGKVGRIHSGNIYIFHPFLKSVCSKAFSAMGWSSTYLLFSPLLIFGVSILFSVCFRKALVYYRGIGVKKHFKR